MEPIQAPSGYGATGGGIYTGMLCFRGGTFTQCQPGDPYNLYSPVMPIPTSPSSSQPATPVGIIPGIVDYFGPDGTPGNYSGAPIPSSYYPSGIGPTVGPVTGGGSPAPSSYFPNMGPVGIKTSMPDVAPTTTNVGNNSLLNAVQGAASGAVDAVNQATGLGLSTWEWVAIAGIGIFIAMKVFGGGSEHRGRF